MIWIIGGTSEAGKLVDFLARHGKNYIMSVATEEGKEFFENANLQIGRMTKERMLEFCKRKNITVLADLSHPYAVLVSQNAKAAAFELGIKYIRYARKTAVSRNAGKRFKNISDLQGFLRTLNSETVFFTTGSKNIKDFEAVRSSNRFIYRILPVPDSILKCKEAGVLTRNIVAMTGPVSKNVNKALFSFYGSAYVVMKDSGEAGGTKEKLEACKALKIIPLIIEREAEDGFTDLKKIEKEILKYEFA